MSILLNIYNDLTGAVNGNVISLFGMAGGGVSVFTGLGKIKDSVDKPEELRKGVVYVLVGGLTAGIVALSSMAGTSFFGSSTPLTSMGWGENTAAPGVSKEALQFSVMVIRFVGLYCLFSALGSIKTFAHNQDHAAFNTAKVRFVSAVLLVNFPLFVHALAMTMGGDVGNKLASWFPV